MKNIQGANIAGGNPSRGRVDNDYHAILRIYWIYRQLPKGEKHERL